MSIDQNAPMQFTCPKCQAATPVTIAEMNAGTAKCSSCGLLFDGSTFQAEVEQGLRDAGLR